MQTSFATPPSSRALHRLARTTLGQHLCRKPPSQNRMCSTKGDHSAREAQNVFVFLRQAPVKPAHAHYPGSTRCYFRAGFDETHRRQATSESLER